MNSVKNNFKDNFFIVQNDGYLCLRVRRDTSISELEELCDIITKGLDCSVFENSSASWIIDDLFIVIDISICDEEYEKIGTVEFLYEDEKLEVEDDAFYDLICTYTNPADKSYSQDEWDEIREAVVDELIKILN